MPALSLAVAVSVWTPTAVLYPLTVQPAVVSPEVSSVAVQVGPTVGRSPKLYAPPLAGTAPLQLTIGLVASR